MAIKVRMVVDFQGFDKGKSYELPDKKAKRFIDFGVAKEVVPRGKQSKAAPADKMVTGAADK